MFLWKYQAMRQKSYGLARLLDQSSQGSLGELLEEVRSWYCMWITTIKPVGSGLLTSGNEHDAATVVINQMVFLKMSLLSVWKQKETGKPRFQQVSCANTRKFQKQSDGARVVSNLTEERARCHTYPEDYLKGSYR